MPGMIVVGAQWGDEGKGKLVDIFAEKADLVVRYQGGANAGHTLVVDGKKTVLHLIPSGILHPQTQCLIATGVVVDVFGLVQEIQHLQTNGFLKNPQQLLISDSATLLLPYHKLLDAAREKDLADGKIGTTGKGIGPAYEDRAARRALLFSDLYAPEKLKQKLDFVLKEKNHLLKELYKAETVSVDDMYEKLLKAAETLKVHRCENASLLIHRKWQKGEKVIFEGAQGTLLDNMHGTYPFVTSSSTLAGSVCGGAGQGPKVADRVLGVFKAYATRVGSGPFPTEQDNATGEKIRQDGKEFGSTTGRSRRCGWLDLVALKYAIRLNGMTHLALMKLDILSGHEKIGIATAYKVGKETVKEYPTDLASQIQAEPVYEWMPGWTEDISKCSDWKQLPVQAQNFLQFLKKEVNLPLVSVSVGPGREQIIWSEPGFF